MNDETRFRACLIWNFPKVKTTTPKPIVLLYAFVLSVDISLNCCIEDFYAARLAPLIQHDPTIPSFPFSEMAKRVRMEHFFWFQDVTSTRSSTHPAPITLGTFRARSSLALAFLTPWDSMFNFVSTMNCFKPSWGCTEKPSKALGVPRASCPALGIAPGCPSDGLRLWEQDHAGLYREIWQGFRSITFAGVFMWWRWSDECN